MLALFHFPPLYNHPILSFSASASSSPPSLTIVSINVGGRGRRLYTSTQRSYAARHGYAFTTVSTFLDSNATHRDLTSFQKILASSAAAPNHTRFVLVLDTDVLIAPWAAPIHVVAESLGESVGMVDEAAQPSLRKNRAIKLASRRGHPEIDVTAYEYYRRAGLEIRTDRIFNTGFMLIQPAKHARLLRETYDIYAPQAIGHPRHFHFEQSVVGYELQKRGLVKALPSAWNTLFSLYQRAGYDKRRVYCKSNFVHFTGGTGKFAKEFARTTRADCGFPM